VQDPEGPSAMTGVWFVVGQKNAESGNAALLKPKQALVLLSQSDSTDPLSGDVRIGPGTDVLYEDCLKNGQLNKEVEHPSCIAYFKL
jgi:hypothetical protein